MGEWAKDRAIVLRGGGVLLRPTPCCPVSTPFGLVIRFVRESPGNRVVRAGAGCDWLVARPRENYL